MTLHELCHNLVPSGLLMIFVCGLYASPFLYPLIPSSYPIDRVLLMPTNMGIRTADGQKISSATSCLSLSFALYLSVLLYVYLFIYCIFDLLFFAYLTVIDIFCCKLSTLLSSFYFIVIYLSCLVIFYFCLCSSF